MAMLDENCRSVLIADDSEDIRSFLRALLESKGFTVIEAPDGENAVEIIRQKCPDLILLDLNMPKLDGRAAAEKIREIKGQCEHVPIVALTGDDTDEMKDAALAAGFSDYVAKPIDQGQIEPVLRRLFPLASFPEPPSHNPAVPDELANPAKAQRVVRDGHLPKVQ